MKAKYLLQIAVLAASSCMISSALAQWVWLDEHGVKQFTDVAPPANVPQNRILKQPHGAPVPKASEAADKTDDAGADKAVKEPKTTAEKEADYKKRKLEQAEKDKKAGEEAKRKESNDENCARAKSYLQSLKSGERIKSTDNNGERSYLSDDDRIKEEARAEEAISASCDK
ncbi:MAG: DUF4124 domain-containing protein [Burkholderiaceae bacterium]|nr:DUF4124 domain-containing protein [Burkholderiaceae bacterium]